MQVQKKTKQKLLNLIRPTLDETTKIQTNMFIRKGTKLDRFRGDRLKIEKYVLPRKVRLWPLF